MIVKVINVKTGTVTEQEVPDIEIDDIQTQIETVETTLEEKVAQHDEKIVSLEQSIEVIFGG